MSSGRRTHPMYYSYHHRSTKNMTLCLWQLHDLYLVPPWEACRFFLQMLSVRNNARGAAPGKRQLVGRVRYPAFRRVP